LEYHKQRMRQLRDTKDTLESETIQTNNNLRKKLLTDLSKLEEGISRSFIHQRAENSRLQSQVSDLKENTIHID
jgi:hypothetical protein